MTSNETDWNQFVKEFCGSDFWYNDSYYENSTLPNVTPCFQYTVLTALPTLFIFLLCPILKFQLEWTAERHNLSSIPKSCRTITTTVLTSIMIISSLANFVRNLVSWSHVEGQVFFWYPLMRLVASSFLSQMQRLLHQFGHKSSRILFYSALVLWTCSIPESRSWIERIVDNDVHRPYDIWNCLLFWFWFISLSLYLSSLFCVENSSMDTELDGSLRLFKEWNKIWVPKYKSSNSPSAIATLFSMFKWELIGSGTLRLIADLLLFVIPFIFYFYIHLFDHTNTHLWKGIRLSIIIVVSMQIRHVILSYCCMIGAQVGNCVQTTLGTVTYKKILRMTIDAAEAHNDYLAEEIRVFRLLSSNIHLFWSPALKLWLTFTVLYLFLQNEMLPILITVVALLLLNFIRCDLDVTSKHLKLLNEVISNIRSVKLRGWEKSLQELLNNHRLTETNSRIFSKFVNFGIDIYPQVVPYLLVLIIVGVNIPSPNLFIALYLIYQLGDTISEIRFFVQIVRQLPAANTRLKQFLLADQIEKKEGPALIENAMIMENAYFSIDNQISMPIFVDVNLNIQKGELIAVVGEDMRRCKLFLRALSGELKRLDGNVKLNGSIGYISSNPWIMNTCIRDNIELFAPKGNQAFGKVVRQFGLDDVLIDEARKKTKGYDLNEILTKNQKIRIELARALYHPHDIYLIEDIFNYFDKNTFEKLIGEFFKDKTCIVIMDRSDQIAMSSHVIYIKEDTIKSSHFSHLIQEDASFANLISHLESSHSNEVESFPQQALQHIKPSKSRVTWEDIEEGELEVSPLINTANMAEFQICWKFFRSIFVKNYVFVPFFLSLAIFAQILQSIWLISSNRLVVFVVILQIIMFIGGLYLLVIQSTKIGTRIYDLFVGKSLEAPLQFFSEKNRKKLIDFFNEDLPKLEVTIPRLVTLTVLSVGYLVTTLFITALISPAMILPTILIATVIFCYTNEYIKKSRLYFKKERSMVNHWMQTKRGIQTIRAFKSTKSFAWKNDDFLDLRTKLAKNQYLIDYWFRIRISTVSNIFIFLSLLSLLRFYYSNAESWFNWIAMNATLLLNMPFFLQLFLDQLTKIVKNMHLADKLTLFDSIKPTFVDTSPSDNWPDMGEIRFENLSTYKQPDNISFLQGFSLKIDASKKLFVVGDDDSQIVNSMFRLIEPSGGKILIDDVDLSSINPTRLRRCLSIIPEKPILLSESIRFNLDPLQKTSDDQIWSVLKTVNLDAIISNKWTDGLSHEIDTENDFSAHQIWLLEVARVLLVSSKVLVVEKAIGMIDKLTSDSIVEILAQNVPNSILFMESNLKSTLNYDMPVLWLENGQLRSFDLPSKLISDVPSTSEVKN